MRLIPSNVRKKNKGTTECDKSIITCDIREKNKGTTECDKSTITYDISTTQCEDDTIKCEK